MGATNVGAVLITWHDLPHRAHRVLVAMAHLSLDAAREGQPARRYFAGPGYLAEVLYGPAGLERVERGEAIPTASARRQVEKCLTELHRAGAIRRVVKGAPGRRAEYEVVLTRPTPTTETVGEHPTESVVNTRPNRSHSTDQNGRAQEPLQEHQEHEEENITPSVASPARTDTTDEQGWSDVALFTEKVTGDQYVSAQAHLTRTIGTEAAGERTAAYIVEHPDAGYMDAVVNVALGSGWTA